MHESIYVAGAGAIAQQLRMEVLANNLSNLDTVGFKEDRTVFRSYLAGWLDRAKDPSGQSSVRREGASNIKVGVEETRTSFSPGQLRHTGNPLDLALEGVGFFCVQKAEGIHYTRKGNFALDERGTLVTQEGLPVLGKRGEITIDGKEIVVDLEGNVVVDGARVDTLRIADFPEPYSLEKVGDNFFLPASAGVDERVAEGAKVNQGFVELSNVNPVKVMTEMIEALRGFEAYQKLIQSASELTSRAINEVGRLA